MAHLKSLSRSACPFDQEFALLVERDRKLWRARWWRRWLIALTRKGRKA